MRIIRCFLGFVLAGSLAGCTQKTVLFQEKRDFSDRQTIYQFTLPADQARHKIFLTVDLEFVTSGSYRLGANLSTPSNQMKETEVKQTAGQEHSGSTAGGITVSGSRMKQTFEHLLYDLQPEDGVYRLAVFQTEASPRTKISSIDLRVE